MFAAPPVMEAEVFARIPDSFAKPGRKSRWLDVQFGGMAATSFLEGPSFDRDGNLWVTDIPWGRLFKVGPKGDVTLAIEYDGEPNGLKFHRDGRGFVADHKNGLMVFDPKSGRIEPFLDRSLLERFKGVNDLIFAANGDLYFTDQGQTGLQDPTGRLHRLRTDGRLDTLLDNVPSPNGLVLSLDERIVYLCVTRDNAIWRVPVMQDGSASKVGAFIRMSGGTGPDGMAMDEQGNLAVCHVGFGTVWLFSALGEPLYRIKSPAGLLTTNCAYGGPERKTLFITESRTGSILKVDLPVAGRIMFSHQ
ncbi:MAG TPA: SMP-30/gluconolactonase/LRE family protein [Candidatus Cybelea sp.]|nr:SMP-30/gluconolactonase/LRE family protein [Candidatus Cybelea sp.]